MTHPEMGAMARALAARYAAARVLTEAMLQEIDTDHLPRLDSLTTQRAEELQAASDLVDAIRGQTGEFSAELRDRVQTELEALIKEDHLLRARLAARAQEVPTQLAELRGSQAALGGYQIGAVPADIDGSMSDPLDRRG